MIGSFLNKLGAPATCHTRRPSQRAGRLGRRQFLMRSAAALSALSLSLGVGAVFAPSADAAVTTVGGSVITSMSGVAQWPAGPGYVARDTQPTAYRYEQVDFWTRAVTVDRHLDVMQGVIWAGNNKAAFMRSQITLERWNGSSWVYYLRDAARYGTINDFQHSTAWFFPDRSFINIERGFYRVYTWYWFLNSTGQLIGSMTEQPAQWDYGIASDGAPDPTSCNKPAGIPGCIYMP